jgi:hypothetical protein
MGGQLWGGGGGESSLITDDKREKWSKGAGVFSV